MSLETKIYQRGNRINLSGLVKESIVDLYKSMFLARQLATRDIKSQYRQSFLGVFWAFVAPLSTALVWIFINKSGAVQLDDTGVPYTLFVFTGTILWSVMTDSINSPLMSTNGAKGIISKINFPKEALILSGVYKVLFNSLFKFVLLIFFFLYFQVLPSWNLLLFPVTFLILIAVGTTIGLLITPLGMLYTDVARLIGMGLRFIMYVTPVVFVIPESGVMKIIMEWNPLTPLILVNRNIMVGLEIEYLNYFIGITAVMVPLFLIALVIYRVSIPVIVERLSA